MVVTSEFGSWEGSGGQKAADRLDVLGLDADGRPVVVELKRDIAPDTVDMQALEYAALVSRFTLDDLVRVHAQFLNGIRTMPWLGRRRSLPGPVRQQPSRARRVVPQGRACQEIGTRATLAVAARGGVWEPTVATAT